MLIQAILQARCTKEAEQIFPGSSTETRKPSFRFSFVQIFQYCEPSEPITLSPTMCQYLGAIIQESCPPSLQMCTIRSQAPGLPRVLLDGDHVIALFGVLEYYT